MNVDAAPDTQWSRLSRFIADAMGLHFPRERWPDLQRGLAGAAREWGFPDVESCMDRLLAAPPTKEQLQVLAGHLTIGETYFFREKKTFEVLANDVLPALIHSRRGREQRLRIWSAACCTGEEAYSLAIMIHRLLPDLADWRVTILATDINAHFLRKAVAGAYGEWSFRDAPEDYRERYFTRGGDGRHVVIPAIRSMVTFAHLNLVEDVYPSLATDTNAMDLIFCRNVLMYFTPSQTGRVVGKLHHSLLGGGWLAVSPSEASQALFPQFATLNAPGVIIYRKDDANVRVVTSPPGPPVGARGFFPAASEPTWAAPEEDILPRPEVLQPPPRRVEETPVREEVAPAPETLAEALYAQGRYAETAELLLASLAGRAPGSRTFSLLARAFANQGRLAEALAWCDRWIADDKLDPAGHYLRGVILLEHGDYLQARASLQRAVYVHPDFVLAHFALGNLARGRGLPGEAAKHFDNALRLLAGHRQDDLLPESDNLTAGRLTETIATLSSLKTSR